MSLGVGQGMVSVSPLQMAVAVSVIANGGFKVQPHLVKEIHHSDNRVNFTQPHKERIEWVKPEYLTAVGEGMRKVVTEGSSRYYTDIPDIPTAGKTGTSQNPTARITDGLLRMHRMTIPRLPLLYLPKIPGTGLFPPHQLHPSLLSST